MVSDSEEAFADLLDVVKSDDVILAQRASWPMSYCVEKHPHLLNNHIQEILPFLENPLHPAVRRNTLRSLTFSGVPVDIQGVVFDLCLQFAVSTKEPAAIRSLSIQLLIKIAEEVEGLASELKEILMDIQLSDDSPAAVRSALRHGLKKLRKLNK